MASAGGRGNTGSAKRGSFKCTLKTKVAPHGVAAKRSFDKDLTTDSDITETDQQDVLISSLLAEVASKAPATHDFLCQAGNKQPPSQITYQSQGRRYHAHLSSQTTKKTTNSACIVPSQHSQNESNSQDLTEDQIPDETNTLTTCRSVSELKKRFSNRIRKQFKQMEHLDDSPLTPSAKSQSGLNHGKQYNTVDSSDPAATSVKSSLKMNTKPVPSPRHTRRSYLSEALPIPVIVNNTSDVNTASIANTEQSLEPSSRKEDGEKTASKRTSQGKIIGECSNLTNADENEAGLDSTTEVKQKIESKSGNKVHGERPKPQPRKSSLTGASLLLPLTKNEETKMVDQQLSGKDNLNQDCSQDVTASRDISTTVIPAVTLKQLQDHPKDNRLDHVVSPPEEMEDWESVSDESDDHKKDVKRHQPARRVRKMRPQSVRNKRSAESTRPGLTGSTRRGSSNSVVQWTSVDYDDVIQVGDQNSDGWESDDDEGKNSPKSTQIEINHVNKTGFTLEHRVPVIDEPIYLRENSVTDVAKNVADYSNIRQDIPSDLPRLPRRITTGTSDSSESEEPSTPESPYPVATGLPTSPEQTCRPSPSGDDELSSDKRPPLPPRKNSSLALKGFPLTPLGKSSLEDKSKSKLPDSPETPPLPPRRISAPPSHLNPPVLLPRKSAPCMGTDEKGVRLLARKKPRKKNKSYLDTTVPIGGSAPSSDSEAVPPVPPRKQSNGISARDKVDSRVRRADTVIPVPTGLNRSKSSPQATRVNVHKESTNIIKPISEEIMHSVPPAINMDIQIPICDLDKEDIDKDYLPADFDESISNDNMSAAGISMDDLNLTYIDPVRDIESIHRVQTSTAARKSTPDPFKELWNSTNTTDDSDAYLQLVDYDSVQSSGDYLPMTNDDDFEAQPLYQIYTCGAVARDLMEYQTDEAGEDDDSYLVCEDVVHSLKDYISDMLTTGGSASKRETSTLEAMIQSAQGVRTLWSEMPEVREGKWLDKLNHDQKKLQESLFELITSEASYLKSINLLISHFMYSSELDHNSPHRVIDRRDHHILFSNIKNVRDVSESFMKELSAVWRKCCLLSPEVIARILQRFAANEFEVYVMYCRNQGFQDVRLHELKEKSSFRDAVDVLERDRRLQGLSLQSFLTLPMQRITRLPLLLDSVVHKLKPNSEDYSTFLKCIAELRKLVRRCNDGIKQMENIEKLAKIEKMLHFKNMKTIPVISQTRYLVKEGPLTRYFRLSAGLISSRRKKDTVYLFLFNDLLIITKKKSEERREVLDNSDRIALHAEVIPNEEVSKWLPPGTSSGIKNLMLLVLLEKNNEYLLGCSSETERTRWVEAVTPTQEESEGDKIYMDWDLPQVEAVYKYQATQSDELSMEEGDVINITRKGQDGWYEGELVRDGSRGWFPSTYTQEIQNAHVRARNLRKRYRLQQLCYSRFQKDGDKK